MTLYTEAFDKVFTQTEVLVEPMVKANKLAAANFEKMVEFQLKAWQKYVDLGVLQIKAAAEVDSPKALQAYMGKQIEVANAVRQQMLDDVKSWTDLGADMKDELTRLAEDNVKEFKAATSKVTRKAA